jgi:dihydropyrimidinase
MTGMEVLLPALMTFGVQRGRLGVEDIARLCSENPARRFGLYPRKGVLSLGSDADYVVVDPLARITVTDDYYRGWISDWSIYHGWEFQGLPVSTVLRGDVVVQDGEMVGNPGYGTYVGAATLKSALL